MFPLLINFPCIDLPPAMFFWSVIIALLIAATQREFTFTVGYRACITLEEYEGAILPGTFRIRAFGAHKDITSLIVIRVDSNILASLKGIRVTRSDLRVNAHTGLHHFLGR